MRLSAREYALIFAFWTLLATLSAVNTLLDPRGYGIRLISPAGPVAMAYIESWLWAGFTPFIFSLTVRFPLGRPRWWMWLPALVAIGALVSLVIWFLVAFLRSEVFELPRRGAPVFAPLIELRRFRFVNQLLIYFAVLAAGYAREYFLRETALRTQLAEARLDALRAQINPHFLFNTLNAIAALVERDPAGVRRMIARLGDLLRRTIESSGTATVPLREEIDFLRRYIEIMEIRFQGRLHTVLNIDDDALDVIVPSLVLQPIVENALEHGASRVAGEGRIEVSAHRNGGNLVLQVRDNGPGVRAGAEGVGLTNTRARLEQIYGPRASLRLESPREGGAVATISLPIHA
ncbi:MAG TPA: sensor histidine kinase [Thermoanaerobaculia bacterium]|nr:sensor histidine kinase [Thermoanaerobaculia bacterium]